jgi:ferredoxin-like protein FixX
VAFWFYRGLRRGVVTTRYPKVIDPWTADLPSPPRFVPERLSREMADRLSVTCPTGAFGREADELVMDLGRCTGCGRCLEVAGDAAAPSGWFLLATAERETLIKRVPIRGRPTGRADD